MPWEKDALRDNKFEREMIFEMNLAEVKKTGAPYSIISGLEKERLENAVKIISHEFH